MWVALQATGSDAKDEIFYHSMNDNKFDSYEPNESIADKNYYVTVVFKIDLSSLD